MLNWLMFSLSLAFDQCLLSWKSLPSNLILKSTKRREIKNVKQQIFMLNAKILLFRHTQRHACEVHSEHKWKYYFSRKHKAKGFRLGKFGEGERETETGEKSYNMLRQQNSLCFRARLRHKSRALQHVYAKLNLVRNTNSGAIMKRRESKKGICRNGGEISDYDTQWLRTQ